MLQPHGARWMTARRAGGILQATEQLELAGTQPFCCSNAGSSREQEMLWLGDEGGEKGHLAGFPHLVGRVLQLKKKKKQQ